LNTVATRQVQAALAAGAAVIQGAPTGSGAGVHLTTDAWHTLTTTLAAGRHVVIWTHLGDLQATSGGNGRQVLRRLAGAVPEVLSTIPVSGLVIVGGDTAQAVLRALHATGLSLSGQVNVGVPYGRLVGGAYAGLAVATKAGGFGTDTTLRDGLDFMRRLASQ
jgi:uncharacterized protein YgbK (DUF1537 family)